MVYMHRHWQKLIDMIPQHCLLTNQTLAKQEKPYRISTQAQRLLQKNRPACRLCAHPFPQNSGFQHNKICGHCLKKPPLQANTLAAFTYATPLNRLIHDFKFNQKLDLANCFSRFLFDNIKQEYALRKIHLPEAIIPVPLYTQRFFQRGFNQAYEIAKPLSKLLNISIEHRILRRIENTPMQSGLSFKDRQKNLRDAFQVTQAIKYKHIAVLDDVMTTGATAHAVTNILMKSGVKQVDIWVLARTPNYYNLLR